MLLIRRLGEAKAMTIIHFLADQSQAASWSLCGFLAVRGTLAGQRIREDCPYEWLDRDFPGGWRFCQRCERIHEAKPREDA